MADRKQFSNDIETDPELERLLEQSRQIEITQEMLIEQRISFAFGNAPADAEDITKESVRHASQQISLRA
jgi:hypothetical protein